VEAVIARAVLAGAAALAAACSAAPVERPLGAARAILAPSHDAAPETGPLERTATYLPDGTRLAPGSGAPKAGAASGPAPHDGQGSDTHGDYTCPMHPEVRSDEPGECPTCGMDLVHAHGDGGGR